MSLAEHLNHLAEPELRRALTQCCAAPAWVAGMAAARPFQDDAHVHRAAEEIANRLDRPDWLAAFSAHPKIGDVASLRAKYSDTQRWASGEQSGVAAASEETLTALARLNRDYEACFGYIFIVCATGKNADEMLAILQDRLRHSPEEELRIAAGEQLKITHLRLDKLHP